MATRFLLGSFEACVAPTFIAIIQMWYRRGEQTVRNAAWYAQLGVVNIVGLRSLASLPNVVINSSSLAWKLAQLWACTHRFQCFKTLPNHISVLWSAYRSVTPALTPCKPLTHKLSVIFSVVVFIWLPDSPMNARFLSQHEKVIAIERLRMNQQGISSGKWRWDHVWECLLDPKTWIWTALLTAVSIPSGGITTFGPLIVQSFGFTSFQAILFNMPFGAVQIIATLGGAFAATHWKAKSPFLAALCVPPIIGLSILHSVPHDPSNRGVLLFAYYITSVYPAISPMIYS